MAPNDVQGSFSTSSDRMMASRFDDAVRQLAVYAGDPLGAAEAMIADEPDFIMAHVLKAWLYLLGSDAKAAAEAQGIIAQTDGRKASQGEQGHIAAIRKLAAGEWHGASRIMEDVSANAPRDLLALIAGHQIDFFTGNSRMLRDRISRVLPHWTRDMPGYHSVLGMHAFGLEEMGDYARAEAKGREALAYERRDGWARHAVAHVMEMQGRQDEGIAFMRGDIEGWTKDSFFAVHNWWHLALYHLELEQFDEVLRLADGPITTTAQDQMLDLVDASALLWRLSLLGVDVGDRWSKLAKRYEGLWVAGYYAFNDLHAVMAFIGAGREDLIEAVLEAQAKAEADNVMFTRDVGTPLIKAFVAFGRGQYAQALGLMRPVRGIAFRFGGSHAQRDIIDLTMIEAAIRSRDVAFAAALTAERAEAKHDSPLVALFSKRLVDQRAG